jgi:glycosyltransferase involved in cell wall biosynthesis/2-polyprenyl-3-methyl-5-hydroxy-6-metoxy-1,4-benzoquinol methylase
MRWPRISIVTPSYNQGKFIGRTVRSVLLQRYPNLDYILMDGGSTDDTVSCLAPYRDQFSYFVSAPDDGQADAIAKGFARSSGEIMAYLNSDDLLAPDALHFVANYFESHPDVDFIYSHRCTVDENDRVMWYWVLPPHSNSLMKRWDFIPQETCFWRRSLFEKAGNIDPSYHFAMDYDLFVRFMTLGRVRRVNRFLGAFRQHSESKTTQYLGIMGRREMLKVRRKFGIQRLPHDGYFGMLLSLWVNYAGRRYASGARTLPGTFAGLGYDYNDLWGGVLRGPESSCEQDEQNRTRESKMVRFDPTCPITLRFPDQLLYSITSSRGGRERTSDIYIQLTLRTAIILPSLGDYWRQLKKKTLDAVVDSAPSAASSELALPADSVSGRATLAEENGRPSRKGDQVNVKTGNQSVESILALTRGLVSENEEVDFLNVGCDTGKLLDALKAKTKWKLSGLETRPSAAAEAISKGHQIYGTTLEEAAVSSQITKCFDLIYLDRRIERFEEPRFSLRNVAVLLNPGGFLVLSTPNLDSKQLELFGSAWAQWKPEEHRYIFSKKSLKGMLSLAGFGWVRLLTVSYPDSTALSLENFSERGAATLDAGDHPRPELMCKTEAIAESHHLMADRQGKGDEIFAICKRLF